MDAVRPGERFRPKASEWNAFRDAADFTRKLRREGGAGAVARGMRPDTILVKNTTEEEAPPHGVLALGSESVLSTDMDETRFGGAVPCIEAVLPSNETHAWCVLLEPLAPGQIGRAQVSGVALVRLTEPGIGLWTATPAVGSFKLIPGRGGSQILWKDPDADLGEECWALVRVNGVPESDCLLGRLEEDFEDGVAEIALYFDGWQTTDEPTLFCVPEIAQLSTIPEGTVVLAHRVRTAEEPLVEEED